MSQLTEIAVVTSREDEKGFGLGRGVDTSSLSLVSCSNSVFLIPVTMASLKERRISNEYRETNEYQESMVVIWE